MATSTQLMPVITTAGITALFNASSSGLEANITHVALGDGGYTPDSARTALANEMSRVPVASGKRVGGSQLHLTIIENTNKAYWVREVGFYLADGTLFAIYSSPTQTLTYKTEATNFLLAFDLVLSSIPAGSVNVIDQGLNLDILMAQDFAKMARAQIDNMTRNLRGKFLADEQRPRLSKVEAQVDLLTAQPVPSMGAFSSLLKNPGYQKLPGGLIIQWGMGVIANAGDIISFPIPFSFQVFSVVVNEANGSFPSRISVIAGGITVTGFKAFAIDIVTNNEWVGGFVPSWIAIGI